MYRLENSSYINRHALRALPVMHIIFFHFWGDHKPGLVMIAQISVSLENREGTPEF